MGRQDLNILIGGEAGQGLVTIAMILTRALVRLRVPHRRHAKLSIPHSRGPQYLCHPHQHSGNCGVTGRSGSPHRPK